MSFKINGLEKLKQGLKNIESTQSVTLGELMPPCFIVACSEFKDIQGLFDASPFKTDTPEDLKAIPDDEWDVYIAEKTTYPTWGEMRQAAVAEWTRGKLNLR
jgi:hypothetical protein